MRRRSDTVVNHMAIDLSGAANVDLLLVTTFSVRGPRRYRLVAKLVMLNRCCYFSYTPLVKLDIILDDNVLGS
jgi:hypothetical protein